MKLKQEKPKVEVADKESVVVDQMTVRSDADVMLGHFCRVTKGEYAGRYGVYESTSTTDKDGYPHLVVVQTRDDDGMKIEVLYSSIERANPGGR